MLMFRNNSVKYTKSIAIVDLLNFTKKCSETRLRYGGKCGMSLVANLLLRPTVKFFLNRPTFLRVMNEYRVARFMAHGVYAERVKYVDAESQLLIITSTILQHCTVASIPAGRNC